ncbi:hypothetical protein D3C85_1167960 [compost metagenome]
MTYSPENVMILIAGVYRLEGLMDGSFLTISKNSPIAVAERTADGSIARLINKDDSYSIAVTLTSTTEANDFLTKLALIDRATNKGIFPIFIKDTTGSSMFFTPSAWIEVMPDQEFTDEISPRTWVFRAAQCVENIGSNGEESELIEDLFNLISGAAPAYLDLVGG